MAKAFTVKLVFRDENSPPMFEDAKTIESARATAFSWLARFAGVKGVLIDDPPEGMRHIIVADGVGGGEYMGSIPLDAI